MRDLIKACLAGVIFSGGAVLAAEENRPLSSFEHLNASQGVRVHVGCGAQPGAVLRGEPRELADINTWVEGSTLHVERKGLFQHNHETVDIDVTTSKPLREIAISTGTELEAQACAVSPEKIDLSLTTGAVLRLAGKTEEANIEANTGAEIEPLRGQRFDVQDVKVNARMGASIHLCTVGRLRGDANMGAEITTESVSSRDISTYMGADISTKQCGKS